MTRLNTTLLKVGITMICLTAVVSIAAIFHLKLDQPVFFQIYADLKGYSPENNDGENAQLKNYQYEFTLQHMANEWDERDIIGISFPEAPELQGRIQQMPGYMGYYVYNGKINYGINCGQYNIRVHNVKVDWEKMPDEFRNVSRAEIHFSDGDVREVYLGELLFKSERSYPDSLLKLDSTPYFGDERDFEEIYLVEEDIILKKVEASHHLDIVPWNMELTVNGMDYREIEGTRLRGGDVLTIKVHVSTEPDGEFYFDHFNRWLTLVYEDVKGNEYENLIVHLDWVPYNSADITFENLYRYLKGKEVL